MGHLSNFHQIANGLRHLHDLEIVHGNLNSGNIVLCIESHVKLGGCCILLT
jgi:serine/threonine protein kinase